MLSIHDDAQPTIIFTNEESIRLVREALPDSQAEIQIVDARSVTPPPVVTPAIHNEGGIAFLQYTSGSTGAPKGTIITHANLLANLDAIQSLFQHEPEHEFVTWLPPFHDMGLMGLLTPLYRGMTVTQITPDEFLRQPLHWLKVIASRKAQVSSGAPNFAYQLLAERISDDDLATLDLSRWRIAFNGAEPVRAETLEKFARKFAPCGFRAEAWLPCYGLAETTLLASGRLGTGQSEPSKPVSCGIPARDTRITIHHRENGVLLSDGEVGEIYVHSPSVALGYWQSPEATAASFPQPGTLRTGDLGFFHCGELYVTGRVKDLIIIRGRNLYPHDIENCVAALLPTATGANGIAAFEFPGKNSGSGELGLLIEVPRVWVAEIKKGSREMGAHVRNIRQIVAEKFEVAAGLVAFVAPGDFPRTSSGKVQRNACRDGVLNRTLPVIFSDRPSVSEGAAALLELPIPETQPADKSPVPTLISMHDSAATAATLIQWLRAFAARRLNSQLMDERRTVAPHVVLEFGNHGLFGLEVPRTLGGLGLTTSDSYRVMEQLAAIDLTLALFVGIHNALGLHPILRHGPAALREELIPAMAAGRQLASFAITELSAGSNPKTMTTIAVRGSDGGWTIHGRKQWIGTASWAGTISVIAKARDVSGEHLGSVALAVPADAEGVSFGPEAVTMGMRGTVQVPVFFDGVKVDAARVLGEVGRGFEVAYDAMRLARVGLAALSLGAMKRCLQWMTTYAMGREVASGNLADIPATQARLAETVNAIAAVEALVRAVGGWLDAGVVLPEEVFLICKTTAPELLGETADRAMQMLGARGYMENNGLPQLFRDARLLRIFEGPTEALNASLGARLRRGSDALCAWMETMQGGESAAVVRTLTSDHPMANDVALGELASLQFLRWIVNGATASWSAVAEMRGRSLASATPLSTAPRTSDDHTALESGVALTLPTALQDAAAWLDERLRQRSAAANATSGTVVVGDIAARLKQEIGAFDQTLPGEDRELDPLLRNVTSSDRVAVKDGSRGFQPTVGHAETNVSRSDTGTTAPSDGNNDDHRTGSNVATRRDDRDSTNRGLKSTATFRDRYAVGQDDALITQLERGLLDFLRREKLGNLDAVPHDATFSSLGIDSLGAASLAIEIEKTFGVKITDETLYDYPTLQRLAGYIESRRAPVGTPTEKGRTLWQRAVDGMNERVRRVEKEGHYFYEQPFEAQDSASVWLGGRRCVHLSSYSYLGFVANEEGVTAA